MNTPFGRSVRLRQYPPQDTSVTVESFYRAKSGVSFRVLGVLGVIYPIALRACVRTRAFAIDSASPRTPRTRVFAPTYSGVSGALLESRCPGGGISLSGHCGQSVLGGGEHV